MSLNIDGNKTSEPGTEELRRTNLLRHSHTSFLELPRSKNQQPAAVSVVCDDLVELLKVCIQQLLLSTNAERFSIIIFFNNIKSQNKLRPASVNALIRSLICFIKMNIGEYIIYIFIIHSMINLTMWRRDKL